MKQWRCGSGAVMCGDVGAVVMWDDGWGDSGCSVDVG